MNAAPLPSSAATPLASVQILRALAALMVAFSHAQHDALVSANRAGVSFARSHLLPWDAGVDLFFVISGFIMVYASARHFGASGAAGSFLIRRSVRIIPLYWLLAGAYLVLASRFAGAGHLEQVGAAGAIASFLFWPFDVFRDGHARPFYDLAWTLNYEMFFYLVFACFLGLERIKALIGIALAMAALVFAGLLWPGAPLPFRFWMQPIILEFVLGMALAEAYLRGFTLPRAAAGLLILAGLAVLVLDPMGAATKPENWITPNDLIRLACWGLPMAAIMAGLLFADYRSAHAGPLTRFGVALGDASYALYLSHPFVIILWRKIWLAFGLDRYLGFWPMVATTCALCVLAALVTYRILEKPMTRWLGARLVPQPSLPRAGKASSR